MSYSPPLYPSTIPNTTQLPDRTDDVDWLYAARYNELKKELRAVMNELGVTPSGGSADVATRLGTFGTMNDVIDDASPQLGGDLDLNEHDIKSNGAVAIQDDNSGGIIGFPNQSGCSVYMTNGSSNQTSGTGWTKLILDTENYDTQNEFDSSTNYRFTATKAGKYLVNGLIYYDPVATEDHLLTSIRKNNSLIVRKAIFSTRISAFSIGFSHVVSLAANDYIEIWSRNTSNNLEIIYGDYRTFLTISKIQ